MKTISHVPCIHKTSIASIEFQDRSYLNGVLPLGEVDLLLDLLLGLLGGLVLGESATQGTGVLGSEVEREERLVLVEQAELGTLVEVDDGENAGDRLANVVAVNLVSIYWSYFLCGYAIAV